MTISVTDLLKLPPGVMAGVLVMLWPAIWAGASFLVAFAGDVIRRQRHTSMAPRKAA
jgi:hypothetical protein